MDTFGAPQDSGELAHLGQGYLVDIAVQQGAQPKLAEPVPERKKKSRSEPVNECYKQLGHPNLVVTLSTAKARDVSLTCTAEIYNACKVEKV